MSTTPNAFGTFLAGPSPFFASLPAISTPNGTTIKPGGRIAAYVRSTGALDGDDYFAASGLLVGTIDAGLARCRADQNDVVFVLPGHSEMYSASGSVWPSLVNGAQVLGCGVPGATNCPTITLSNTGASLALNKNGVTVQGLNIKSATAAVTGAIVITGTWVTLAGNFISFTGALGANSAIQLTGAIGATLVSNHIVVNSTQQVLDVTSASANIQVIGNMIRQSNTSGGTKVVNVADAATSGFIANNYIMTAANPSGAGTTAALIVVGSTALPLLGTFQNFSADAAGGSGVPSPTANGNS